MSSPLVMSIISLNGMWNNKVQCIVVSSARRRNRSMLVCSLRMYFEDDLGMEDVGMTYNIHGMCIRKGGGCQL